MMQTPTITEDGGGYTFEWGAGVVIEVLKVKRTRWGDDLDVRVLDKAQGTRSCWLAQQYA